jgi:hypothetical protein
VDVNLKLTFGMANEWNRDFGRKPWGVTLLGGGLEVGGTECVGVLWCTLLGLTFSVWVDREGAA